MTFGKIALTIVISINFGFWQNSAEAGFVMFGILLLWQGKS
jgi:hypothetical protein